MPKVIDIQQQVYTHICHFAYISGISLDVFRTITHSHMFDEMMDFGQHLAAADDVGPYNSDAVHSRILKIT